MSLASLLGIAKSALTTHQRSIDVTAHNIANVMTPGYTRQRLLLSAEVPLRTHLGTIGRGVTDNGVQAERNSYLDASFRREQGSFSHADTLRTLMGRVEGVFAEPSDHSLGAALDGLFNAFNDLANDPSGSANRAVARQAANEVIQNLHSLGAQFDGIAATIDSQFKDTIAQVNQISVRLANLNRLIVSQGGPQHNAADLVDERGRLLDQLAGFTGVRVLPRSDGSVGVLAGDQLIVDGAFAQELESRPQPGGGYAVGVKGGTRLIGGLSGALAGLIELGTQGLPGVRGEVDRLVAALVTEVNTIHRSGSTPGGATGTDFFDPARLTADSISLAAPIAASPANIAAGATSAPGDGTIALQIAALRSLSLGSLNGSSIPEFYTSLVSNVGSIVSDAGSEASTAEILLSATEAQRHAEHGVSTDEELIHLMAQQQAYAAAARLVSVADEMVQDLLRLV